MIAFAVLGAFTGVLSAATFFLHLGSFAGIKAFGHCFGINAHNDCTGVDRAFYLFPGPIFGVLVGAILWRGGWLSAARACAFALASSFANAFAVFVFAASMDPIGTILDPGRFEPVVSLSGAIAGAVGGGLLGIAATRLLRVRGAVRLLAAGAGLGLLVPIMLDWQVFGIFALYLVWQGGYAVALASILPPAIRAPG